MVHRLSDTRRLRSPSEGRSRQSGFLVVIPARHVEENDTKPLRFSIVGEQEHRNSTISIRPAIHTALYLQQWKRFPWSRKYNVARKEFVECRLSGNEANVLFSILCKKHLL